jgi:hypothetical protein
MKNNSESYSGGAGYVYILQDPLHINKIKIGRSLDPTRRIEELYGTSSAARLQLRALWATPNAAFLERSIQAMYGFNRISSHREFFLIADQSWFSVGVLNDPDSVDAFLWEMTSEINEAISTTEMEARFVPLDEYFERVHERKEIYPRGPKGF